MPALPPNSLIAVTGITGYIASHVGLAALQAGHRVRGTVRSLKRAESLRAGYIKQGIPATDLDSRLEFVVVDNLLSSDQWQNAIEGVAGVVHLALPMNKYEDRGLVDIAVEGMLSLLRAAKRVPSIQRVVVTSSSAAVVSPPIYYDKVLTDEDWNDDAVRIVEENVPLDNDPVLRKTKPFIIYAAAKTQSEKAAWEFMKNEKPQFDLVTTLPNMNFGPVLHGEPTSTSSRVAELMTNEPDTVRLRPPQWFVDVRDCARLHVIGLTHPSLSGKRIWAAAAPFGWNAVLAVLRKNFPDVTLPADFEDGGPDRQKVDSEPARALLGGWISLEKSVVDLAKSLGY